ncbi:MAG TPA: aspartate aminotransferase family protein, partial [Terrimesophilobacter sp.]|nr:aspartate aminotransferase family protein [Terrimesophilobacter sp.]
RSQFFATTRWPGYPVVNPTMLGSKSAGALAASWAIIEALGQDGFAELTSLSMSSTRTLLDVIGRIEGLRVVGDPVGPLFTVAADDAIEEARRVDPHHWADEVRGHGFVLQQQPGHRQADGVVLPRTTHLTITPVTAQVLGELSEALVTSADAVRGVAPATVAADLIAQLTGFAESGLDSDSAAMILGQVGIGAQGLPERMAPFMALIEALPAPLTERLLIELLGRLSEPSG